MKQQSTKSILITWAELFVIAYFYNIKPDYEYSWWWMILHGLILPENWVLSLFDSAKYCKAPLHTTAYNVFWWIACIGATITTIFQVYTVIASLFRKK